MPNITIKSRQMAAHRMIQRWGGMGFLIRGAVQRACTMALLDYTPKVNGVALDRVSRLRVSQIGLATPPDFEQDEALFANVRYRLTAEPVGPRIAGVFIFFDCDITDITAAP